jgi:hypothetical protein
MRTLRREDLIILGNCSIHSTYVIIKHVGETMNLVELVKVTFSEEEAEKFLKARGILKPLTAVHLWFQKS